MDAKELVHRIECECQQRGLPRVQVALADSTPDLRHYECSHCREVFRARYTVTATAVAPDDTRLWATLCDTCAQDSSDLPSAVAFAIEVELSAHKNRMADFEETDLKAGAA